MKPSEFLSSVALMVLPEKRLYKYRSLADETQKSRVKDILVNNRIRFSRFSELNDPIEGKPILQLGDWASTDYRSQFAEYVWQLTKSPNKVDFVKWIHALPQAQHEAIVKQINDNNQIEIEARWRILSLSATPVHDLLWSHYSDGHKGVALVFDAARGEFAHALKMRYVPERLPLDVTTMDSSQVFHATILTKRSTWNYEDEYRCFADVANKTSSVTLDNQFMSFKAAHLLGVIFGAKTPPSDVKLILSWAAERTVPLDFWKCVVSVAGAIQIAPYAP